MKTNKKLMLLALLGITLFSACKKDEEEPPVATTTPPVNEEEVITTVELHFTKVSDSSHFHVSWKDPDGDGGNAPTIDSIKLDTNSHYRVEIKFKDESGSETEDITEEVKEEAAEHLVCYDASNSTSVQITVTDSDGTYPIGLSSEWMTTQTLNGSVKVLLKHQPGVKDGSCSPGETDVEVDFPLTVKQ